MCILGGPDCASRLEQFSTSGDGIDMGVPCKSPYYFMNHSTIISTVSRTERGESGTYDAVVFLIHPLC